MKTNHAAEVAALAEVVRAVFAELAAQGRQVGEPARAALALVEQWIAGEPVTVEALEAAASLAHEDGVPLAAREKDRARSWANTAAGNLAYTVRKGRGWQDGLRTTMDAAEYALGSLGLAGPDRDALASIRTAARTRAAAAGRKGGARPAKRTTPRPARVEDELGPWIGQVASDWLRRRKAVFEPSRRAGDAALRAFLAEREYPDHAAVLAFEQRFGGLVVADEPGEDGADWLLGAFACLSSGAHEAPRGASGLRGDDALVPVVYAPSDVIYYLDGRGVAWSEDTIEGGLAVFAADGARMVARMVLYQSMFARGLANAVVELEGRRGVEVATALGVPAIAEASDDFAKVWGDARVLVLEERASGAAGPSPGPWKTRVGAGTKKLLSAALARLR